MNNQNLKEKVIKGSLWTLLGSSGHQIFGFVVFIILSQQLSPTEFGIVAIALILIEFSTPLITMGLTQTIIRENELTELTKNTVFWISSTLGFCIAGIIFCIAGWMADMYNEPEVKPMLQALAIIPIFTGLTVVHIALLERAFEFKKVAVRQIVASLISGIVAITLVLNDAGMYSIVAQRLTSVFMLIILLWWFVRWRPSRHFSWQEAKRVCRIGSHLMTSSFIINFTRRAVDSIIGYFLGPAALGYLRITAKLQDFILKFTIEPLVKVGLPTFSTLQDDRKGLTSAYLRFVQMAGLITLPAFIGLAIVAPEFIVFVFGEQWLPSAQLMQILSIASISMALNFLFKPLMIAAGKTRHIIRINLIEMFLVLGSVSFAVHYDLTAVVIAQVISLTLVLLISLSILQREIGIMLVEVFKRLVPPACAVIVMTTGLLTFQYYLLPMIEISLHPVMITAITVVLGGLLYVATLLLCFPNFTRNIKNAVIPLLKKKLR